MRELPESSVDAVVTDPPYGLAFMGKHWDTVHQGWHEAWAREALRVLKPGGYLLAFGGTRTYHRLACAIEDAGFEIRDSISWLYASGFPKSHDVSKAIDKMAGNKRGTTADTRNGHNTNPHSKTDKFGGGYLNQDNDSSLDKGAVTEEAQQWQGWGTALKPAHEPIVMARKPLSEKSVARNVLEHGTGAINVDGCRVGGGGNHGGGAKMSSSGKTLNQFGEYESDGFKTSPQGRWPANLILSHHEDCQRVGVKRVKQPSPPGGNDNRQSGFAMQAGAKGYADPDGTEEVEAWECVEGCPVGELGESSRFFYIAKASRKERGSYLHCDCQTVKLTSWLKPDLSLGEKTALISQLRDTSESITREGLDSYITSYGNNTTDKSHQDTKSITLTKTSSITESKTLDSLPQPSTNGYTVDASLEMSSGGNPVNSAENSSQSQKSTGTSQKKDGHYTGVAVLATFPKSSLRNNCADCGNEIKAEAHPTQKPIALMRYLVRMVTQPGGTVLDPFTGSGSTGCAALLEGFDFIGIEREEEYIEIAKRRIEHHAAESREKLFS